jgi:succinate dehydrogenase hydrophobic anchor subunit
MMDAGSWIRGAWELVPILLLVLVGGVIAMRSGVNHLTSRHDLRQVMGNLSQLFLRILAYAAAMLLVHEWIGMRPGLGW